MVTSIQIIDPCLTPDGIRATSQVNPPPYYFDLRDGPLVKKINPFSSIPPGCDITYSCVGVTGPDPDLACDIPGVTTFDGDHGISKWTFQSTDFETYSLGTYIVEIEGVTGINSQKSTRATFEVTLENPCLKRSLVKLREEQPFKD